MLDYRLAELARETVARSGAEGRLSSLQTKLILSKDEDRWFKQRVEEAFCTRPVITPQIKSVEFVVRLLAERFRGTVLSFLFLFYFFSFY